MPTLHLRREKLYSPFLRVKYLHKLFRNLLYVRFISSLALFLNYLFIYISMNLRMFILCSVIIQSFFMLLLKINKALFFVRSFSGLWCPFDTFHHNVFFKSTSLLLALKDVPGSFCIFLGAVL